MSMDRPINPDPDEHAKIRRAFKAASVLRWTRGIAIRLLFLIGLIVGVTSGWYWGVAIITTGYALTFRLSVVRQMSAVRPHLGRGRFGSFHVQTMPPEYWGWITVIPFCSVRRPAFLIVNPRPNPHLDLFSESWLTLS